MKAKKAPFEVHFDGKDTIISGINRLSLADTLDCGQAFRWKYDGAKWHGVAFGKALSLFTQSDKLILSDTTLDEFEGIWRRYFDLDRDYEDIINSISEDETLHKIVGFSGGIRILRQEPWEALCSFIISQNNNIPRIKGIIDRLCENFGEPIGDGQFAFPTPERIADCTLDDLAPIRSGFRAKYILDAALKISSGQINLDLLDKIPLDEAKQMLMTITGVGPKVSDCALLFGCGRIECFPADVWIKRAMSVLFDGSLPSVATPYAGIVQQYIFHYARLTQLKI